MTSKASMGAEDGGQKKGTRAMQGRLLRCYCEGKGENWEAICLDLDIAVQGQSFQEVYASLNNAIIEYVDYVVTLPQEEQRDLLYRSAPLSMRLRFLWYAIGQFFSSNGGDDAPKQRGEFLLAT